MHPKPLSHPWDQSLGQRIAVIGTTGSGKTTLAKQLAQAVGSPHIELDALYWEPNWVPAEPDRFRDRVQQALENDHWVIDGNYSGVRDIVWGRADTLIFLDYPFCFVFQRLLRRTLRRSLTHERLWNGNHETFRKSFLSQESILLWLFRTYWRNRSRYPALVQKSEFAHLAVMHMRSPHQTIQLLNFSNHGYCSSPGRSS